MDKAERTHSPRNHCCRADKAAALPATAHSAALTAAARRPPGCPSCSDPQTRAAVATAPATPPRVISTLEGGSGWGGTPPPSSPCRMAAATIGRSNGSTSMHIAGTSTGENATSPSNLIGRRRGTGAGAAGPLAAAGAEARETAPRALAPPRGNGTIQSASSWSWSSSSSLPSPSSSDITPGPSPPTPAAASSVAPSPAPSASAEGLDVPATSGLLLEAPAPPCCSCWTPSAAASADSTSDDASSMSSRLPAAAGARRLALRSRVSCRERNSSHDTMCTPIAIHSSTTRCCPVEPVDPAEPKEVAVPLATPAARALISTRQAAGWPSDAAIARPAPSKLARSPMCAHRKNRRAAAAASARSTRGGRLRTARRDAAKAGCEASTAKVEPATSLWSAAPSLGAVP